MAPKNILPPSNASSDSETDDSNTSSYEEEEEDEQQLSQSKPEITQQESQESDEEDDDSDSDSDSVSDSDKIKTPSKPIVSPESKKPVSKSTPSKTLGKRPAEVEKKDKDSKNKKIKVKESVAKDSKSKKKSKMIDEDEEVSGEIEDKKTSLFTRVWTEKDEIVLLQGFIDYYKLKKGADPIRNLVAFHDSVEDLLSFSVSKNQLADKIRRLKKKFLNNVKKGQNGEDPVFSRPHEYQTFELSKKIWGNDGGVSEMNDDSKGSKQKDVSKMPSKSAGKEMMNLKEEVKHNKEEETGDCWSLYPYLCDSLESEASKYLQTPKGLKEYVREIVSGLEKEMSKELEEGWKGYYVMQQKLYAERVKMISKQTEAVTDVFQP